MCCRLCRESLAMMIRFQILQCYQLPDFISSATLSGHTIDNSFAVLWVVQVVRYLETAISRANIVSAATMYRAAHAKWSILEMSPHTCSSSSVVLACLWSVLRRVEGLQNHLAV